jgi:hypothetical protein
MDTLLSSMQPGAQVHLWSMFQPVISEFRNYSSSPDGVQER